MSHGCTQAGIYDAPVASVRHVSLPTNEVEVSAVITEQSVSNEAPVVGCPAFSRLHASLSIEARPSVSSH